MSHQRGRACRRWSAELRGEKIDIITWTQDPRVFIAEALNRRRSKGWRTKRKVGLLVVADSSQLSAIGE